MKTYGRFFTTLALAAILARPTSAQARKSIGVLKDVKGSVTLAGGKRIAGSGAALFPGDRIKTGTDGIAHVAFDLGAVLLIKENSDVTLDGPSKKPAVDFKIGEFLIGLARKLQAGERFRVKTPEAVASVRGTLVWGKTQDGVTSFAGFSGKVAVTANGKTVRLKPGEQTSVVSRKPPEGLAGSLRGQGPGAGGGGSAAAQQPAPDGPEPPKPHAVPLDFLKTFSINGSIQDLDKLVDHPK
ncbi:MAG: FecR domain-containing protein [Elusimicrobia bacterium]|nr:FecR domain-containing protein [Elusimicrobiota bacterium]